MAEQNDQELRAQVLIVDDEEAHAEVMAEALQRQGHICTIVHDLPAAEEELRHGTFDVVVTDLVMDREDDGMKVLRIAGETQLDAETIMVTAHGDVPTAKQAIREGAYDFIEKPLDLDVFRNLVHRAAQTVLLRNHNAELREELSDRFGIDGIVGQTPAIQRVLTTIRQVAPSEIPVLVTGESGTGKELVARAIHNHSRRAKKPFKPVNCAGLSASILESELFGHAKGAFTGADKDRQGVFEYADGGTLFMDEIGDMPLDMQAKLLRVLESGEIVRVGDNDPRHVDVRLVSATNHDLDDLARRGEFRTDLKYRIEGVKVHLPPLRERREDIGLLVRHFAQRYADQLGRTPPRIGDDAMAVLLRQDWPGNVRQLMNVVQNAVIVCDGEELNADHLPAELRHSDNDAAASAGSLAGLSLEQIEKQAIRNTLRMTGGNREQAATLLGIGERTLYRKLKEYGLK